jgi:hypothetical protein
MDLAKAKALEFLEAFKVKKNAVADRELLLNVARSSLRTKIDRENGNVTLFRLLAAPYRYYS